MSTRDKLAQLLMVGVTGAADARAVVADHHVGGIMIGSWTDLSMLSDGSLADISGSAGPLPLAVSVDEEGGRVSRLAGLIGSQSSPRVLAQTSTPDEVYGIALERGRQMRALGITVDFAPVVDVTAAADDTVIGDRSFGSDAATVTEYAGAYARGLRDAGVLPVLKHFPGHGSGSGDSHAGSVVTPPLADLQQSDLVPYRTLSSEAPVGVMVGHLQVPGPDRQRPGQPEPGGLRSAALGRLRRAAVQWAGVHRRPVRHGGDHRSLRRRRGRAARAGGRRGHRAVDHHRRGARGAGPVGEGAGGGRADDARRGRLGVADGRGEGPESAVRALKRHRLLTLK